MENIEQSQNDINENDFEISTREQKIIELHNAIKSNKVEQVEENLNKISHDEHAFDESDQSAVATSLKLFNPEIYQLLIINGFRLGPHESFKQILKGKGDIKKKIFEIHRKCAIKSKKDHVTAVRSKCRLHTSTPKNKEEEYFRIILNALEKLDETAEENSTLLKIISLCPELQIIFDFNKNSTDEIDPRENNRTNGVCYFRIFCVTIGAKKLLDENESSEVLGTMAHELCHCVLNFLFKNSCKPYDESDESTKKDFGMIVDDYKMKFDNLQIGEEIVAIVFDGYEKEVWHAELIVRVPHLLAHYNRDDDKLKHLRTHFEELFNFYVVNLQPKFAQKMLMMKEVQVVEEINNNCGLSSKLQKSVFNIKANSTDTFEIFTDSKYPQILKSNCVELTLKSIYEKAMKLKKLKSVIFLTIENFESEKIAKEIFAALESYENIVAIVGCDEIDQRKCKLIEKLHENLTKAQKIVFVSNEKLKIAKIECKEVNHLWSELTEESQKKLLNNKVVFQGSKVELNDIWSKNIETVVDSVPFDDLSKQREIQIGEEIKFQGIHIERIFRANDAQWDWKQKKYDRELSTDEIMTEIDNSKVLVLSDAPGNGKSTEFKFLSVKLKENFKTRWILLIDLKKHTKSFENDSEKPSNFNSVEKISKFLAEKILKLKNFEMEVFFELFKKNRVVVLMDGVDEISPNYSTFVMNLAVGIRNLSENQLWMATRPHLVEKLEQKLKTKAWKLTMFSKDNQMNFFEEVFKKHNNLKIENYREKLESFLDELGKKRRFDDEDCQVTNPLLLHMIVELIIDNPKFQLQNSNLYKVYHEFVKKMFKRLLKKGSEAENDAVELMENTNIQEFHRKIAVEEKTYWKGFNHLFQNLIKPTNDQLLRVGLMFNYGDERFCFIHETFKEFFVAQTIFEKMFNQKFHSKSELEEVCFTLVKVIEIHSNRVVMKLLDDALENFKFDHNCELSKIFINTLEKHEMIDFRIAASYEYNNLITSLSKLVADNIKVERIWLKCHILYKEETILMKAFRMQTLEKFQRIWSFAEEFFTENQIKLLLTNDNDDFRVRIHNCFTASIENKDERIFELFLKEAEKRFTSTETEKLMDYKSFSWLKISSNGNVEIEVVINRLKKFLSHQFRNYLKDLAENFFNDACKNQNVESIKFLCNEIIENFSLSELRNILRRTNMNLENVLMYAVQNRKKDPQVFETLVNFIKDHNEIKLMLLQEDHEGFNVLMYSVRDYGDMGLTGKVLEAYEKYFEIKELMEIFIKENKKKKNILDIATSLTFGRFELIWSFMQKHFDDEYLNKLLIKSLEHIKNYYLYNFMHCILRTLSVNDYSVIFQKLLECAKEWNEYQCNRFLALVDAHEELANLFFKKLFEFKDNNSKTIIDYAKENPFDKKVFQILNEKKIKTCA